MSDHSQFRVGYVLAEFPSVTETFVACCEEGNFAPLKRERPADGTRTK